MNDEEASQRDVLAASASASANATVAPEKKMPPRGWELDRQGINHENKLYCPEVDWVVVQCSVVDE